MATNQTTFGNTQTFLIECSRANSLIDTKDGGDFNSKWSNETQFNLRRGDVVSVEMMALNAQNAAGGNTLEFTGDKVVVDGKEQEYCDNKVLLEVFFYMNNNNTYSVGLPFIHPLGAFNDRPENRFMPIVRTNAATNQYGFTASHGTIGFLDDAIVAGQYNPFVMTPATSYVIVAFNTGTLNAPNYITNLPAVSNPCISIVLAQNGDPNPNGGKLCTYNMYEYGSLTIANAEPMNWITGLTIGVNDNTPNINFPVQPIAGIQNATGAYAGRCELYFSDPQIINTLGVPMAQGVLTAAQVADRDGTSELGLPNYDNILQTGMSGPSTTSVNVRGGKQLYNYMEQIGKPQAGASAINAIFPNTTYGEGGNGNATVAWDYEDKKYGFRNANVRRENDGKPYILMRNDFYGQGRIKPNASGFYPKLMPQTAFILLEAKELFTDVQTLANTINDRLHEALSPFDNDIVDNDKYLTNDLRYTATQFKSSSVIPASNTAGYYDPVIYNVGGYDWRDIYNANWSSILPIKYGGATKVQPANFAVGWDYVNAGIGMYGLPLAGTTEQRAFLKKTAYTNLYINQTANAELAGGGGRCNYLDGNLLYANMYKCMFGDRLHRLQLWNGNETTSNAALDGIRNIGRPVILNTQLAYLIGAIQQASTPLPFLTQKWAKGQLVFTNIYYPMAESITGNPVYEEDEWEDVANSLRDYETYGNNTKDAKSTYIQQNQDITGWCWEMDLGITEDEASALNFIPGAFGVLNMVPLNPEWQSKYPSAAEPTAGNQFGSGANSVPVYPSPSTREIICPTYSNAGFGTSPNFDWKDNYQAYRGTGYMSIESRFDPNWRTTSKTVEDVEPLATETVCKLITNTDEYLNNANQYCDVEFMERINMGMYPYEYTDQDGNKYVLCAFRSMYDYEPNFEQTSTLEMGQLTWGLPIGVSPSSFDNHKIAPMNGDQLNNEKTRIKNTASGSLIEPTRTLRNNMINYVHMGANNPTFQFNQVKNRFEFVNLQTDNYLTDQNIGSQTAGGPGNVNPQIGDKTGIINGQQADALFNQPNPITHASYADNYTDPIRNSGVRAEIGGIGFFNIWLCPPDYEFPEDINPVNYWDNTDDDQTEKNRQEIIKGCVKGDDKNWEGCLLDRLGFSVENFKPRYGRQSARFDPNTYNNPNPNIVGNGIKPCLLNNSFNGVINPSLNIYWETPTPSGATLGTPKFNHGFNQNESILIATQSLPLTAENSPILTQSPFYIVYSDIVANRQYQTGSTGLPAVFYCMKNYANGGFLYGYGSTFSIMVNQDRLLSQINTEIRNPNDGRLAKLSSNSVIVYKIQRQTSVPAPLINVFGQDTEDKQPDPNLQELDKIFAEDQKIASALGVGNRNFGGSASGNAGGDGDGNKHDNKIMKGYGDNNRMGQIIRGQVSSSTQNIQTQASAPDTTNISTMTGMPEKIKDKIVEVLIRALIAKFPLAKDPQKLAEQVDSLPRYIYNMLEGAFFRNPEGDDKEPFVDVQRILATADDWWQSGEDLDFILENLLGLIDTSFLIGTMGDIKYDPDEAKSKEKGSLSLFIDKDQEGKDFMSALVQSIIEDDGRTAQIIASGIERGAIRAEGKDEKSGLYFNVDLLDKGKHSIFVKPKASGQDPEEFIDQIVKEEIGGVGKSPMKGYGSAKASSTIGELSSADFEEVREPDPVRRERLKGSPKSTQSQSTMSFRQSGRASDTGTEQTTSTQQQSPKRGDQGTRPSGQPKKDEDK